MWWVKIVVCLYSGLAMGAISSEPHQLQEIKKYLQSYKPANAQEKFVNYDAFFEEVSAVVFKNQPQELELKPRLQKALRVIFYHNLLVKVSRLLDEQELRLKTYDQAKKTAHYVLKDTNQKKLNVILFLDSGTLRVRDIKIGNSLLSQELHGSILRAQKGGKQSLSQVVERIEKKSQSFLTEKAL